MFADQSGVGPQPEAFWRSCRGGKGCNGPRHVNKSQIWVAPGLPWFCGSPHRGIRLPLSLVATAFGKCTVAWFPLVGVTRYRALDRRVNGPPLTSSRGALPFSVAAPLRARLVRLGEGAEVSVVNQASARALPGEVIHIYYGLEAGSQRPLVGLRLGLAFCVLGPDRVLDVGANQEGLGFGGRLLLRGQTSLCDVDVTRR